MDAWNLAMAAGKKTQWSLELVVSRGPNVLRALAPLETGAEFSS